MKYALVPIEDIEKLKQEREDLYKFVERKEPIGAIELMKNTGTMWKICYRKYEQVNKDE